MGVKCCFYSQLLSILVITVTANVLLHPPKLRYRCPSRKNKSAASRNSHWLSSCSCDEAQTTTYRWVQLNVYHYQKIKEMTGVVLFATVGRHSHAKATRGLTSFSLFVLCKQMHAHIALFRAAFSHKTNAIDSVGWHRGEMFCPCCLRNANAPSCQKSRHVLYLSSFSRNVSKWRAPPTAGHSSGGGCLKTRLL